MEQRFLIFIAGVCCLAGCAGNSKVTACQAEKEQLLTTIRTQRDTTRGLQGQVASLESRLDQAEKELARAPAGTRLSSVPSRAADAPSSSPSPGVPPLLRSEGLQWRSPAGKADAPAPDENRKTSADGSGAGTMLLALARRDRRVHYDSAAHAATVEVPIAFNDNTATLSGEDKRQLDDLARLLKSDDARELRVMVAGFAAGRPENSGASDGGGKISSARQLGMARAQAVADYLDRHGIAQERLAVSGTGLRGKSSGGDSGVQVYLLDADAPVVGWGPTTQSVPATIRR